MASLLIMSAAASAPPPARAQPPAEAAAFCKSVCDSAPNVGQCNANCLKSPAPKIAYTADMAPIGTPVPLRAKLSLNPDIFALNKTQGVGVFIQVSSDVIVNGRLIIKRDAIVSGHYVGTVCAPTVGLVLGGDSASADGVKLPNAIQWLPLSFRDPHDPAGSDVAKVSAPLCVLLLTSVSLTAYVSGSPSAPTMAAALARFKR